MVGTDSLLDEYEVVVRARVEELRVRLADAERDLEHVVITRQTLRVVLSGQAVVADGARGESGVGQGSVAAVSELVAVPVRGAGMTEAVLPEGYRGLWLAMRGAVDGVRSKQLARELGLGTTPAKVEGVRSKLKRLAARGWAVEVTPGLFQAV